MELLKVSPKGADLNYFQMRTKIWRTMTKSVVLITGVTTGFGKEALDHLSSCGHIVYGTTRDRQKYLDINGSEQEAKILKVDLASDDSVLNAVEHIIKKEGRIDVLVNNAGYGVAAPIDDTPVNQVKEIFEINFFAVLRMIQTVLPHMRASKSGLIINISSLAGLAGVPYLGLYCSSKFAIEGLSEALAVELRNAGINVVLIEPGDSQTGFSSNRLKITESKLSRADGEKAQQILKQMEEDGGSFFPSRKLALLIEKIMKKKTPRLRYTIGSSDQIFIVYLKKFIPFSFYESLIKKYFKI